MGTVLFSCPVVPSPYPCQPPKGTTPRLAPKSRHGRQADPRRSPHQGPGGASLPAPSIRKRAEPGVSAKPPPKNGRQRPNGIRAWTSPTPFHPKRTENRRLRQRPQTKGKGGKEGEEGKEGTEGKEGGEGRGRKERRKGGRKPESRKAEKLGSRKPGSREAGGGIKKRRRTVGCTSACGSQQSLAYRNYLLR